MDWDFKVVSGNRCPRQFEYHPSKHGMVFGTITGEVCAIDIYNGESLDNTAEDMLPTKPAPIKSLGYFGKNKNDTMLGLCWLRSNTDEGGMVCGENKSKGSLFLSGSSKGRVCLGDASREYDPSNRDAYSIVHDYPAFERLTSVHVNSTNQLILMSGYSTGVNVVDVETSQIVRKFENIHKDHVNISRFSNLSPHLFATSSFDATIKTWDMRQSAGANAGSSSAGAGAGGEATDRPVYTVQCNSGVVMINFSRDDNFILASALDNEINQYLFLDGRKHLTYNIPRTGLKSNFTRAYYSASGRHTLTGACEESTVKIMCTYTGEPVTTVDLYPGKKDSSIYIQSLRGCPVDEDQICVLANYRDIQSRELIMVTRNRRAYRAAIHDTVLPARTGPDADGAMALVGDRENVSFTRVDDPSRSVASWFPSSRGSGADGPPTASTQASVFSPPSGNSPYYPSPRPGHRDAYLMSPKTPMVGIGDYALPLSDLPGAASEATGQKQGGSEDDEFVPNNSLMCFYSAKYLEDMRHLCGLCAGLVQSYTLADGANAAGSMRLVLNARDGTEVSSCTDLAVLVHPRADVVSDGKGLFVLPVHTFVLQARCPVLFELCARQQQQQQQQQQQPNAMAELRLVDGVGEIVTKAVPVLDLSASLSNSVSTSSSSSSSAVPSELLHLFPVLVDFLYSGAKALDALTIRYYSLQRLVHEDSEGRSLAAVLFPHVDELLQAEIADFSTTNNGSAYGKMDVLDSDGDEQAEDHSGAARRNHTATMFLPVTDAAGVELLLKVCVDDHCWRQSAALAKRYTATVRQLLELSRRLRLPQATSVLSSLLEKGLCPMNAVAVYDAAVAFECVQLVGVTVRYIASHSAALRAQLQCRPDVANAVAAISAAHFADVVTRTEFRDLIETGASRAEKKRTGSALEVLADFLNAGSDSDDASDVSDTDAAVEEHWQLEEVPYLPPVGSQTQRQDAATSQGLQAGKAGANGSAEALAPLVPSRSAVVCLPRYISASVTPILQDTVIFLGGQNLDRLHTFRNRVLSYNYAENEFRFLSTGGDHIPKCGYMSCVASLQKCNATHVVALGGKIKKAEISVQHTTLPQHLQTMHGAADGVWRKMQSRTTLTRAGAAATWSNLIGVSVDAAGPVSVVSNRLIDVWNLNADREELSQPTAEAHAAQVSAALRSLSTNTVDADGNAVRVTKTQNLVKTMGLIYELDCETLTWRSPSVEIAPVTQISAFNAMSPAVQVQQEQEVSAQRAALERRVAQAVAPLHPEDVAYRRCGCLFSACPAAPCTCSAAMRDTSVDDSEVVIERSWVVQFGGYCDQLEVITDDLHILTCERRVTTRRAPAHAGSSGTTGTGGQEVTATTPYTYKWSAVRAAGTTPAARFSHSMTTIPAQDLGDAHAPLKNHTRILIFGGVGYNLEGTELASLRINRSAQSSPPAHPVECQHYAHWETVEASGSRPVPTGSHTLVHIPGTDLCVLHGGAFTGTHGELHNRCNPHTYLLRLVSVRQMPDAATTLVATWTRLSAVGVPPTLRSRHCSFSLTRTAAGYAEVMVFGGVDELKLARRQSTGLQHELSDLDEVVKDSVMHTLQLLPKQHQRLDYDARWMQRGATDGPHAKRYGNLLYFRTEPSVQVAECTLSRDMLRLLDALFDPRKTGLADVNPSADTPMETEQDQSAQRMERIVSEFLAQRGAILSAPESALVAGPALQPQLCLTLVNTDDSGSAVTTPLSLYQSLLCTRCAWFSTLLTSGMKGGQQLTEEAMDQDGAEAGLVRESLFEVDPIAFKLLMIHVYADALMICSLGDVVAVLELANQFDLPSLALQCEGVLVRLMTLDNVCELLDYADTLNLSVLKTACTAMLLRDVISPAAGKQGTDYATAMFADLPAPDGSVVMSPAAVEETMLDDQDERSRVVTEFQALGVELRSEVLALYRQTTQVYGATAASRSSC